MSGLAAEIRTCAASEQFDLGGFTEQRASDLIRAGTAGEPSTPRSNPLQPSPLLWTPPPPW